MDDGLRECGFPEHAAAQVLRVRAHLALRVQPRARVVEVHVPAAVQPAEVAAAKLGEGVGHAIHTRLATVKERCPSYPKNYGPHRDTEARGDSRQPRGSGMESRFF
jgi:hypothetical protein